MAPSESSARPPRVPTRLVARIKGMPGRAAVVDLSTGGVALETRAPLTPGDRVMVELFDLDGYPIVEVPAEVVHVGAALAGIRAGMRFTSADGDPLLSMLLRAVLAAPEPAGRRAHPRARLELPAFARQGALRLVVVDVAMGGMGLLVDGKESLPPELKPGAQVKLQFVYSPGKGSAVGGEVAWALRGGDGEPGRFGVRFVFLPEGARQSILKLVDGEEVPLEIVVEVS